MTRLNPPQWIRGYAAPFNRPTMVRRTMECIAPGAFVLGENPIELLLGGHEGRVIASTADQSLRLSQDTFGLAFAAQLPDVAAAAAFDACSHQASVRFLATGGAVQWQHGPLHPFARGDGGRLISEARIDHIALLGRAAYGVNTGAWIVGQEQRLHGHLRDLARTWSELSIAPGRSA